MQLSNVLVTVSTNINILGLSYVESNRWRIVLILHLLNQFLFPALNVMYQLKQEFESRYYGDVMLTQPHPNSRHNCSDWVVSLISLNCLHIILVFVMSETCTLTPHVLPTLVVSTWIWINMLPGIFAVNLTMFAFHFLLKATNDTLQFKDQSNFLPTLDDWNVFWTMLSHFISSN